MSWLGNLIWTTVVKVDGWEEQHVALLGDSAGDDLDYFAVDRLFVISHEVLVQQLLDLVGAEHPADVLNDFDVVEGGLLELQKLGGLHEMLKLKRSFGHFVGFTPFFNSGDVVVDL